MIRREALRAATNELLTAALIGDDFEAPLTQFADAADAVGVVLSLDNGFNTKDAVCTPLVAEGVRTF
ncbi:MAG TPA: hypothetical protein VKV96_16185, partial [Roseiarcus sp.]|nr:hypothetical protein [Roseiarcus sp.]